MNARILMHRLQEWSKDPAFCWRLVHAIIVIDILCWLQKPFFYDTTVDGFSLGMRVIDESSWAELSFHPLSLVHIFRYIGVAPLWWVHETALAPLVNGLCMVAILWPLVSVPFGKDQQAPFWRVVFFYIPCFLSLRSVMVTVGFSYIFLLLYSNFRSRLLYVLSALFVNMSSASVFLWVLIHLCNPARIKRLYQDHMPLVGLMVAFLMVTSLSISVAFKITFFQEAVWKFTDKVYMEIDDANTEAFSHNGMETHENTRSDDTVKYITSQTLNIEESEPPNWWQKPILLMAAVIDNNTVLVSFRDGNYIRSIVYGLIFVVYLYCLLLSYRYSQMRRNIFCFLLASFPVFLMEGLGVIALILPMVLLIFEKERIAQHLADV